MSLVKTQDGRTVGQAMEELVASGADKQKILRFIDKELISRDVYQERFMSTTMTQQIASDWAHSGKMGIDSSNGCIVWDISAPAGTKAAFCEDFNIPYGKENEVLVQRGSALSITGARYDEATKTWIISASIRQK